MKFSRLFLLSSLTIALSYSCLAQSANTRTSPNDYVVSVHELPLPAKAARAFDKGSRLLAKGDAQGSLSYFLAVIDQAPASYRPYHNIALAYYNLGQFDAAAQNFQKAIDLTGGNFAPSFFGLSVIFYRRSQFQAAETVIRQGLLLQPYSAVGKYCLGLVQYSLGRIADAQRSAQEALALNPAEAEVYVLLGRIHELQHNPAAALTDAQTYLKLAPHGDLQSAALDLLHRNQAALVSLSASLN